jgi:DNA polymerase I-like protein with 3'-5' exonuclease and polymerase domains
MMRRGVAIDKPRRARLGFELSEELARLHHWLSTMAPQEWLAPYVKTSKKHWSQSNKQQQILFYELLGLEGQRHRKTGNPTINFEALEILKRKNPELTRVFNALSDARSVGVFHNTFISAELEPQAVNSDRGRMRCSFNTAGTETFRWSSSSNAFNRGTNLQNIPAGDEE